MIRTSGVSLVRLNGALVAIGAALPSCVRVRRFMRPPAAVCPAHALACDRGDRGRISVGALGEGRLQLVNVGEVTPQSELRNIRIYEFDKDYRLRTLSLAETAVTEDRMCR